ncbi:thiamine-phosphate kinase [bacterium]|nr:thiamine-phosphate kinase [bacterium]
MAQPKLLSDFTEEQLISFFDRTNVLSSHILKGIGDDCAVLSVDGTDSCWLLTQDSVVEGKHFRFLQDKPFWVGWKSLARSISDIAAMSGIPKGALVSLGLPKDLEVAWINEVYDGIHLCAERYDCPVIGGDMSSSDTVFLSVTIIGQADQNKISYRSGAQAGDFLCVTGKLGGSIIEKHFKIEPRVNESIWLAENASVTSMIDLSDGIGKDLFHLAKASDAGFEIFFEKMPVSQEALRISSNDYLNAFEHTLYDGEDYELLFTLRGDESSIKIICRKFESEFDLKISVIGKTTDDKGEIKILKNNAVWKNLKQGGYEHFFR